MDLETPDKDVLLSKIATCILEASLTCQDASAVIGTDLATTKIDVSCLALPAAEANMRAGVREGLETFIEARLRPFPYFVVEISPASRALIVKVANAIMASFLLEGLRSHFTKPLQTDVSIDGAKVLTTGAGLLATLRAHTPLVNALVSLVNSLEEDRDASGNKRKWIFGAVVLLILISCSSSLLMFGAGRSSKRCSTGGLNGDLFSSLRAMNALKALSM